MPQGFSLDLSGLKQVQKAIENINSEASKGIADEMSAAVLNIQKDAKRTAPANLGKLRQSIQIDNNNTLFKSVYSSVNYAPYVEFGTRKNVRIPNGYEEYAAQFKGKGMGGFDDLLLALLDYVKKKRLAGTYSIKSKRRQGNSNKKLSEDLRVAERMAYFILKNGIKPQPFMIPAFEREKPKLLKRLKKLFK